jgi:hypothetical protein
VSGRYRWTPARWPEDLVMDGDGRRANTRLKLFHRCFIRCFVCRYRMLYVKVKGLRHNIETLVSTADTYSLFGPATTFVLPTHWSAKCYLETRLKAKRAPTGDSQVRPIKHRVGLDEANENQDCIVRIRLLSGDTSVQTCPRHSQLKTMTNTEEPAPDKR